MHCEKPVENETLLLRTSGNMRDALAPPIKGKPVTFERMDAIESEEPSKPSTTYTPGNRTMSQTKRETVRRTWRTRIEGEVAAEGIDIREHVVTVVTELPPNRIPAISEAGEVSGPGKGVETVSAEREHKVAGEVVETQKTVQTKVFYLDDASEADSAFMLEFRNDASKLLKTAQSPFEGFAGLPESTANVLTALVRETMELERDVEVQIMSACWNAIWAVRNIHKCFGDIVESVGIEAGEFVAIVLKGSNAKVPKGRSSSVRGARLSTWSCLATSDVMETGERTAG